VPAVQSVETQAAPEVQPVQPVQMQLPGVQSVQMQSQVPHPPREQARRKGVRLKNAALFPKPVTAESAQAGEERPESKPDSTPVAPVVEVPQVPKEDPRIKERKAQFQSAVLLGRTQGFARNMMLHFWKMSKGGLGWLPHSDDCDDLGYRTAMRDTDTPSPGETWRFPRKDRNVVDNSPASWRRDTGKSSKSKGGANHEKLKPGANAYRVLKATTREAELSRDTRSLLNKICPENRDRIIERLAQTRLDCVEEMEIVINIIFDKVTNDPHYCETYVDMIHALHKAYPQFPPAEEGAQPCTFRRMLVNTCQDKFEGMTDAVQEGMSEEVLAMEPEERKEYLLKSKRSAMATMKFIGHLFVRQLLAAAVIKTVVGDLLNGEPPELQVEYALELLQAVGKVFDGTEKDKAQLTIILNRLNDLKSMKGADGKQCLSKRVQFMIDDLADLRSNGWKGRGFKEEAKTKDTVREEAEREEHQAAAASQVAASRQGGNRGGNRGYGRGH